MLPEPAPQDRLELLRLPDGLAPPRRVALVESPQHVIHHMCLVLEHVQLDVLGDADAELRKGRLDGAARLVEEVLHHLLLPRLHIVLQLSIHAGGEFLELLPGAPVVLPDVIVDLLVQRARVVVLFAEKAVEVFVLERVNEAVGDVLRAIPKVTHMRMNMLGKSGEAFCSGKSFSRL